MVAKFGSFIFIFVKRDGIRLKSTINSNKFNGNLKEIGTGDFLSK